MKLFGNIAKGAFVAVHFIAPNLRFDIPEVAPPMFGKGRGTVWQTNFTRRVTLAVYANYLFNRLMAPAYEFRMVDDAGMQAFIDTCDERSKANFSRLQIGAAKADFWRVLVLQKNGGVYLDMDAGLIWPLASTLKDHDEYYIRYADGRITNYFFASVAGTPSLQRAVDIINGNIEANTERSVWNLTGPGVFERAIEAPAHRREASCIQGLLTNEYFQYIDRPAKKWTAEELTVPVVKPESG